jgi:hypothetical protein
MRSGGRQARAELPNALTTIRAELGAQTAQNGPSKRAALLPLFPPFAKLYRSKTMQTCETCRFLEPDNRPDYAGCGTCRRFPPIVVETVAFDGSGANHFSQHRPWMNKGEWCGEYQEQNND